MTRDEETEILASIYLFYKDHSKNLRKLGYSFEEAFWINFACLPFLPWDTLSKNNILLSQILRLYLGIYQYYTGKSIKPENIPAFIELLKDRYHMARDYIPINDSSPSIIEFGRSILPKENNVEKLTQAGSIVANTASEWQLQRKETPLSCGLEDDI